MKLFDETYLAERNRDDIDNYQSFEVHRDSWSHSVYFRAEPIYALVRHCTPAEMAETLRWMATEIESIGGK